MPRNALSNWRQILITIRVLQCLFSLLYFVLLAFSVAHHGWWMVANLRMAMGFGFTASILSLFTAIPTFVNYDSRLADTRVSKFVLHFLRTVFEWVVIGCWSAAFITMLLNKGKDFKLLFDRPPYATWTAAVVLAAFQVAMFCWSSVVILQEKYIQDSANPFSATVQLSGLTNGGRF